jgi:serine protease Do
MKGTDMKDLDKDKDLGYDEDNTSEIREHQDFFKGDADNVQDNQDFKESTQESSEELFEKSENNEKKENAAQEEGADHQKETGGNKEETRSDETVNTQYGSYYTPPYYVPNFTINNDGAIGNETPQHKSKNDTAKKVAKIVLISAIAAVCLFGAFALGLLSGNFQISLGVPSEQKIDLAQEEIVVVKNSPVIDIQENIDSDYVPQSLPEVVQKVGNSVVEISTSSVVTDRFYGQYVTSGAGSGVIITQNDTAGYLLTNHHVIEGAKDVIVRLTSKEEYRATVVGSNKSLDLAVLRIEKKSDENFTVAPIGNSSQLIVGQDIVAIGNPLGSLGGTVTDGIISALDRNVVIDGVSMTLLQHNAAINPGNSGGALFDMMGNLVGIVNAKTSDTGIEGLGFAIPINIAFEYFRSTMNAASIGASVDYGYNNDRIYGVYVVKAYENSQFQYVDRIIKINDTPIESLNDFYACIDDYKTGDTIEVTVIRDRTEIKLNVTLS